MTIIIAEVAEKMVEVAEKLLARGGAIGAGWTPSNNYPQFLLDNQFLGVTAGDWIKIIGAIYVLALFIELTCKYGSRLYKWASHLIDP